MGDSTNSSVFGESDVVDGDDDDVDDDDDDDGEMSLSSRWWRQNQPRRFLTAPAHPSTNLFPA